MRKKSILALTGIAFCVLATPAFAQEEANFQGPHVRAIVGWDNFSAGNGPSTSKDGAVFGGGFGYDFQRENFVVGIESELTSSSGSASWDGIANPADHLKVEAVRDIFIGARAGYVVMPQLLLYGKIGYSNFKVKNQYDANMPGSSRIKDKVTSDGFRVGAGLKYRFSGNFYARGEYRYTHYGDVNDYELPEPALAAVNGFDVDVDRSQVIVGIGYRF